MSFSENGARHNPWVESLWSRIKHECESLIAEAQDLDELAAVVHRHFAYYNARRRHSGLGNISPMTYLKNNGLHPLSDN
ncbi:MAG: integrase core domain-containing protein [Myxococcota bacterium]